MQPAKAALLERTDLRAGKGGERWRAGSEQGGRRGQLHAAPADERAQHGPHFSASLAVVATGCSTTSQSCMPAIATTRNASRLIRQASTTCDRAQQQLCRAVHLPLLFSSRILATPSQTSATHDGVQQQLSKVVHVLAQQRRQGDVHGQGLQGRGMAGPPLSVTTLWPARKGARAQQQPV